MKNEIRKFVTEDIVRIVGLQSEPEILLLDSLLENIANASPSLDRKSVTLERLKTSLSQELTFGEFFSSYLQQQNMDPKAVSERVGLPEDTIRSLARDNILPFSVPVVLMKRLIQYLGIQIDVALKSLELTTVILADAMSEDQEYSAKVGVSLRRGYEISLLGIEPKTARSKSSVLQSSERYLQRLKQIVEEK